MARLAFAYGYVNRFDGGINSATSPLRIADNEVRVANNAVLTNVGALKTRGGYKKATDPLGESSATILFVGSVLNPLGGDVTVTLTEDGETPVDVVTTLAYLDTSPQAATKIAADIDAVAGWSATAVLNKVVITNDAGNEFAAEYDDGGTLLPYYVHNSDYYQISKIHALYVPGFKQTIVAARTQLSETNDVFRHTSSAGWVEITGDNDFYREGRLRFIDYNNILYMFDGSQIQYYRGAGTTRERVTFASGSREVKARLMAVSDDRLFAVDSRYPNQLFYTEYSPYPTEIDFATNNNLNIPERYGDQPGITAMVSFSSNDELLVCRENQVYALLGVGPIDYQLVKISSNAGCVGADAICATPYGQVVMAGVGNIFAFEGGSITSIASNKIINQLRGLNMRDATVWYDPKIDSVIIATYKKCFVWHCSTRGWTTWDISGIEHATLFGAASDSGKVLFSKGGNVLYELGVGIDDDGDEFNMVVETKAFDLEMFADEKQLRSVKVVTDTHSLAPATVEMICDDGVHVFSQDLEINKSVTLWGSESARVGQSSVKYSGSALSFGAVSADTESVGNTIAARITTTGDTPVVIYGIALEIGVKPRRREEP